MITPFTFRLSRDIIWNGRSEKTGELIRLEESHDTIKDYILDTLSGNLYCLSDFSMGQQWLSRL